MESFLKKDLLITLRHPGPADAVLPIIPMLDEIYNVKLVVTDTAINILNERYNDYIGKYEIYYPGLNFKNGFVKEFCVNHFKTQYEDDEVDEYEEFFYVFEKFIKQMKPNIVLRTTPAYGWGIDEILPRAIKRNFDKTKIFCYQECYGVGRALKSNEHPVASFGSDNICTVDEGSVKFLKERDISSQSIGWLSHIKYKDLESYSLAKSKVRVHYNILEMERVFLYAVVKTGNILEEVEHFSAFLSTLKKVKEVHENITAYIKYHPRNTSEDVRAYEEAIKKIELNVIRIESDIPYAWILALPDVIYSVASNLNIDALAYQFFEASFTDIEIRLKRANCLYSIYSYDDFTKKILVKATGEDMLPSHTDYSGHIIVDNTNLEDTIMLILNKPDSFSKQTKFAYNNFRPYSDVVNNIISFLGD